MLTIKNTPKEVDTNTYINLLMELVHSGKAVNLVIAGGSMSPFLINRRDQVQLTPLERAPKKGDIVLYQRENGDYILHRICRVRKEGYDIVGDAQVEIEGPVAEQQICCIVEKVCRKGRWIDRSDFWWKFFAGIWLWIIPLRRPLMSLYSKLKGHKTDVDCQLK